MMNKRGLSLLFVCLLVISFFPIHHSNGAPAGNSYYVAESGDDGDDGSLAHPWATIQHAVNQIAPGDTILVLSGIYLGARIESSGTSVAWKTLKAAPGADVLVNAPGADNRHNSNLEVETWEGDGRVAYWVIEGLEVADAPNWGIDIRGNDLLKTHHITVRGNRVHDSGITGIFAAFTDDVLIEGNESYNNGEHGIYVNNSSDYFTIRGNWLHGNAACGVHLNGDASMGGDGIMSGGLVEKNIIYENGSLGGAGINMDGVVSSLVRNNLLYRNHATGIAIFYQDGAVCSQDNRLLNNTILVPADGRWAISVGDVQCVDNRLFNNIMYSAHGYRGSINLPAAGVSGFQSDYNVVTDRFTTDDGNNVISLNEWQALGYDIHSFIASPAQLFLDPAGDDYHLLAGSPAIDAGMIRVDVPTDLEGKPRPMGAGYDIGAYEYPGELPVPAAILYLPLVIRR